MEPDMLARRPLERLIEALRAGGALRDAAVEAAMRARPRHLFLRAPFRLGSTVVERYDPRAPDEATLAAIYADDAIVTRWDGRGLPTSSCSQPAVVVSMLQHLDLRPGMRVLEIGAGTGWNAGLMAHVVGESGAVTTIDIQEDVVAGARAALGDAGARARVVLRDGADGAPEDAPFDRIVATVGCPDVPVAWFDQLAANGSMLVPLAHATWNPLTVVRRDGTARMLAWSGFMPLAGALATTHALDRRLVEHDPARTQVTPSWPGMTFADVWSVLYLMGLEDERATFMAAGTRSGPGLRTDAHTFAFVARDGVVAQGESAPVADLERFRDRWIALGRPALEDYRCRFTTDRTATAPEGGWAIDGPAHRRLIWLEGPHG